MDLFLKVTSNSYFKNNFGIFDIIKESPDKIYGISRYNKLNRKCFLKIKSLHSPDEDCEYITVYTLLKNNKNKLVEEIHDVVIDDQLVFIITEFIEGINLLEYMKICRDIKKNTMRNIIEDMIKCTTFIHNLNIIHGDIKLENIMVTNDISNRIQLRFIDFDLSKLCVNEKYILSDSLTGTANYFAPETYDLCIYSKMTDIWSIGVTLYKLITHEFPYKYKLNRLYHMRIANNFKFLNYDKLKSYENKYGVSTINTIIDMLQFKDIDRKMEFNNNNDI